jgi:cobalt-zinc-cadmium efflux system outer membrane protein
VRRYLAGLVLLPLVSHSVRAQPLLPLLTGPSAIIAPSGRPPIVPVPALPGSRSMPPSLPPLPGAGGPSLDSLEVQQSPGQARTRTAARVPVRSTPPRLLPPAEAARVLQTAIDGAVARNVGLQGAAARRALVVAKQYAASTFLPGAPTLGGAYVTDQVIRNRNARDAEISVSTPIWLPGEGTASVRAADAEAARLNAEGERRLLEVAGEVREALAAVAAAEADQHAAEARLRDARALEADLGRQVRGRNAAEADLLVANADRLEAEGNLSEKTATADAARIDFRTLTGLDPNTSALNEPLPPASQTRPVDPRLTEARRAVDAARASQRLAEIQSSDSPTIGLVGRRTRDIGGTIYDNSVGVQVSIPLPSGGRNRPRIAAAEVEYTDAVIALAKLERDLGGGEARARVVLSSAEAQRDLAAKRAEVFDRQRGLFERSYASGETSLADLIRARTLAYQADAARDRADVGARQARGRLNQALGLMP